VSIDRIGRTVAANRSPHHEVAATAVEVPAPPSPEAVEFVRFCYRRRRVSWPELYDEMCAVAARGTFRGWAYDELELIGVRFTLTGMPNLVALADRIVTEERANLARGGPSRSHEAPRIARPQLVPVPG
jgi:hypothetical protein